MTASTIYLWKLTTRATTLKLRGKILFRRRKKSDIGHRVKKFPPQQLSLWQQTSKSRGLVNSIILERVTFPHQHSMSLTPF